MLLQNLAFGVFTEAPDTHFQCVDKLNKTKKAALREQSGPGIQLLRPAQERLVLM